METSSPWLSRDLYQLGVLEDLSLARGGTASRIWVGELFLMWKASWWVVMRSILALTSAPAIPAMP